MSKNWPRKLYFKPKRSKQQEVQKNQEVCQGLWEQAWPVMVYTGTSSS